MVHAQNFDEQNFDELIVGFIRKALTGKRLEGKTLTNRWPFVKFVKVFPAGPVKLLCYTVFHLKREVSETSVPLLNQK